MNYQDQYMKYLSLLFLLCLHVLLAAQPKKQLYKPSENETMLRLLDSTNNALIELTNKLTESQFFHHIDSATWSPNDIVEHLGLIDEGYVREMWFTLSQPAFPESYTDSTKGGDEKAIAYATDPEKGKARGTNLPRNRYCNQQTCIRVFTETNELAKQFFATNASKDLRRYFIFRVDAKGKRTFKDVHQQGLLMVAHRIRHIEQLKRIVADARFLK